MSKNTRLVRIRSDTLKKIREATKDIKRDPDRFDALFHYSPFRLDRWLAKKPRK